jgi:6-pyruvoyltetrahydropterin/6-carboxytetrahydropterin synthase
MIRLTQGIYLVFNPVSGRLEMPAPVSGVLDQLPLRLWIALEGPVDADSGLLINVRDIKALFRQTLIEKKPHVKNALDIFSWARKIIEQNLAKYQLVKLQLEIIEKMTLSYHSENQDMIEITTKYTLAASHRLWNPHWSETQNRDAFGNCSNPHGHGHNYQVEITLRGKPDPTTGHVTDPAQMDETIRRELIEPFDHKNLNVDIPEFADQVPTVENMVKIFWDKLDGKFHPAELARIAVWETEKTYAEYFGPHAGPLRYSDSV